MANQNPVVSIITVTYNAEKYLEKTIQSVLKQTYPAIEYIVVDGKSKDGTLAIVEKYKSSIQQFISEPDKGLYDAMNKGLKMAKGEYVWFLNAGDEIYAENTLDEIFKIEKEADIYYGDTEYFDLEGRLLGLRSVVTPQKLPKKLDWKSMQMGMVVCHQSIIVKKEIADLYDYQSHPYSADIDWVIKALKKSKKTIFTNQILSLYLQGGFSRRHLKNSLMDRFKIFKTHYGFWKTMLNHIFIAFRGFLFIIKTRKGY